MHDGVLQGLTAAKLQLKLGLGKAAPAAQQVLGSVHEILSEEQRRLRSFVDESRGRRNGAPMRLGQLERVARLSAEQWSCAAAFEASPPDALLGESTARELAFLLSEAIANAVRHGRARSIGIWLNGGNGEVRARISDDGGGLPALAGTFSGEELCARGAGPQSLADRAEALGGRLSVETSPAGTTVSVTLPSGAG